MNQPVELKQLRADERPLSDVGYHRLAGSLLRINHELGYGFIRPDNGGPEFYVHCSSMRDRTHWVEGTAVTFIPGKAKEGSRRAPPAYDVALLRPGSGWVEQSEV